MMSSSFSMIAAGPSRVAILYTGTIRMVCLRSLCGDLAPSLTVVRWKDMDCLVKKYRAYLKQKNSKPPPVKTKRVPIVVSLLSEDEQDEKDDAPDVAQMQKRKAINEDGQHASSEKRRKTSVRAE